MTPLQELALEGLKTCAKTSVEADTKFRNLLKWYKENIEDYY